MYQQPAGLGTGFFIVIEAKPGSSGFAPGAIQFTDDAGARPDLQLQSNRDLGSGSGLGSAAVCDTLPPDAGGVPGFNPPTFDPGSQAVTDALNDFGCRFDNNTGDPCILVDTNNTGGPCNRDTHNPGFGAPSSSIQFCTGGTVSRSLAFQKGDTRLTVQWRDTVGNLGTPAQIIIRVP